MQALLIYLSITAGSGLFFIASLLGGDVDGHDGVDHDVGHDSHDNGGSEDKGSLKEFVSIRNFFLFLVGFGGAGSISTVLGGGILLSLIISSLSGSVISYTGFRALRFVSRRQLNTTNSITVYHGERGRVTVSIPIGGTGEVKAFDGFGRSDFFMARSTNGQGIPFDSKVLIDSSEEGVLLVSQVREIGSGEEK